MDTPPDRERIRLAWLVPPRYAVLVFLLGCYAAPLGVFAVWAVYAALGSTSRSFGEAAELAGKSAAFIFLCQLVVAFAAGLLWLRDRLRGRPPHGPMSH